MLTSKASAQSGHEAGRAVLLSRSFIQGAWASDSYDNLWRTWGERRRPDDFAPQLRARYGLHIAPYENGPLPMGLRRDPDRSRITIDCMLCHGGSILGRSYIGLGNSTLDMQALFEEFDSADGGPGRPPLPRMSHTRGTVEAFAFTARLLSLRTTWLGIFLDDPTSLHAVCEDIPAWWLLKKKKTMYHTGALDARSVRALMQFLMVPPTPYSRLAQSEVDFARIREYILSLQSPPYPFPIEQELAQSGEKLFSEHCASCHGTYGVNWTYPNKIVEIDKIVTDRRLFDAMNEQWRRRYNDSWFAASSSGGNSTGYRAQPTVGYQAPPLDGIWATAPYFHNGSVPTLHGVLNSNARPRIFTRTFRTESDDFDPVEVGWRYRELDANGVESVSPRKRREVYDTTAPCRSNSGHTYGDRLKEPERRAIIEYLKTL